MKRKQFLRDIALGIAATILPRILQPAVPEVMSDEDIYDSLSISYIMQDEPPYWVKTFAFVQTDPLFLGVAFYDAQGRCTHFIKQTEQIDKLQPYIDNHENKRRKDR